MKKIVFALSLAALACAFAADEKAPATADQKPAKRELTKEEQQERMLNRLRKSGGILRIPGKGKVAIVSCADAIKLSILLEKTKAIQDNLRITMQGVPMKEKFTIADAPRVMRQLNAQVALFFGENPDLPMSLYVPEENWGFVNVAKLKADGAPAAKVDGRVKKMYARMMTLSLGSAFSESPASPMQNVTDVASLDKMPVDGIFFMDYNNILQHLPKVGVTASTITTYRRACYEGWAPAPTNEFQKVIYEGVKNGTIKPKHPVAQRKSPLED